MYFVLTVNHPVFYVMSGTVKLSRCLHKNIKWYSLRPGELEICFHPSPLLGVLGLILSVHILHGGRIKEKDLSPSACLEEKMDFGFCFNLLMHWEVFPLSQIQLLLSY